MTVVDIAVVPRCFIVNFNMLIKVSLLCKAHIAYLALVWLLICVNKEMVLEVVEFMKECAGSTFWVVAFEQLVHSF